MDQISCADNSWISPYWRLLTEFLTYMLIANQNRSTTIWPGRWTSSTLAHMYAHEWAHTTQTNVRERHKRTGESTNTITRTHTYKNVHIHLRTHTHAHTHTIYGLTRAHKHIHARVYMSRVWHIHTHTHTHTHTHYAHSRACIYAQCIERCKNTHIHKHIHARTDNTQTYTHTPTRASTTCEHNPSTKQTTAPKMAYAHASKRLPLFRKYNREQLYQDLGLYVQRSYGI